MAQPGKSKPKYEDGRQTACVKCHTKKKKCDGSRPYCLHKRKNKGGGRRKKKGGDDSDEGSESEVNEEASACSEEEEDEESSDDSSEDEAPVRLLPWVACPVCRSKKKKCEGKQPYCLRYVKKNVGGKSKKKGVDNSDAGSDNSGEGEGSKDELSDDSEDETPSPTVLPPPTTLPPGATCAMCHSKKVKCDGIRPDCLRRKTKGVKAPSSSVKTRRSLRRISKDLDLRKQGKKNCDSKPFSANDNTQHGENEEGHEIRMNVRKSSRGTSITMANPSSHSLPNLNPKRNSYEGKPDGTVMPASTPKLLLDGKFARPRGRQRKGMDWDANKGCWSPVLERKQCDGASSSSVGQQHDGGSCRGTYTKAASSTAASKKKKTGNAADTAPAVRKGWEGNSTQHSDPIPAPHIGKGWTVQLVRRGDLAKFDRYYISPEGKKFRSMAEVQRYLNANKDDSGGGDSGGSGGNESSGAQKNQRGNSQSGVASRSTFLQRQESRRRRQQESLPVTPSSPGPASSRSLSRARSRRNKNESLQHQLEETERYTVAQRNSDGIVMPTSTPRLLPDGKFARPAGGKRKGMGWDADRGCWRPEGQPPSLYKKIKVGRELGYLVVVTQGRTNHEAIILGCHEDPVKFLVRNIEGNMKIRWKLADYNDTVPTKNVRLMDFSAVSAVRKRRAVTLSNNSCDDAVDRGAVCGTQHNKLSSVETRPKRRRNEVPRPTYWVCNCGKRWSTDRSRCGAPCLRWRGGKMTWQSSTPKQKRKSAPVLDDVRVSDNASSSTKRRRSVTEDRKTVEPPEQVETEANAAHPVEPSTQELFDLVDHLFREADKDTVTVKDIVRSVTNHFNMPKVEKEMKKMIKARLTELVQGNIEPDESNEKADDVNELADKAGGEAGRDIQQTHFASNSQSVNEATGNEIICKSPTVESVFCSRHANVHCLETGSINNLNLESEEVRVRVVVDGRPSRETCKARLGNITSNVATKKGPTHPTAMKTDESNDESQVDSINGENTNQFATKCGELLEEEVCDNDKKPMLECDKCSQGYHMACLVPPLTEIPKGGWFCDHCSQETMEEEAPPVVTEGSSEEQSAEGENLESDAKLATDEEGKEIADRRVAAASLEISCKEKKEDRDWMQNAKVVDAPHATTAASYIDPTTIGLPSTNNQSDQRRVITVVCTKLSMDSTLGLALFQKQGESDIRVTKINPDSLFAGTELSEGMKVDSINRQTFTMLADCVKFLTAVVGQVVIVASAVAPPPVTTLNDSIPVASSNDAKSAAASAKEKQDVVKLFDASAEGKERRSLNDKQTNSKKAMTEQQDTVLAITQAPAAANETSEENVKSGRNAPEESDDKEVTEKEPAAMEHQEEVVEAVAQTERREFTTGTEKPHELSGDEMVKFRKMLTSFFSLAKGDHIQGEVSLNDVRITVDSESSGSCSFLLQKFFDDLYDIETKKSIDMTRCHRVLFGGTNDKCINGKGKNSVTKGLLSPWKVVYRKQETYSFNSKKAAKEQQSLDTAIDWGGPLRQFKTDIWKQLDKLSIPVRKSNRGRGGRGKIAMIPIFEEASNGDGSFAVPITDAALESRIQDIVHGNITKFQDAIQRAKDYTRAIGRIMLHSFVNGHIVSTSALAPLFINVILRGCLPGDRDYGRDDVLSHLDGIFVTKPEQNLLSFLLEDGKCDNKGRPWTTETIFSQFIPKEFIFSRSVLLGALVDGLTLGGKQNASRRIKEGCGFAGVMSVVPLEAVQKILFSRPTITLDGLMNTISPFFCEGEIDRDMSEQEVILLRDKQKHFYENEFKIYLRERSNEPSFLAKFVECCTGSNYLPFMSSDDTPFKIIVEFSLVAPEPGCHPFFHTCSNTIRLPGMGLYFGDYDLFCQKIDEAIDSSFNKFNFQ